MSRNVACNSLLRVKAITAVLTYITTTPLCFFRCKLGVNSYLIELTHDEHGHPHEVEDTVEEHPEHPRGAGGDLCQIEPETILGVTGGAVDPPV